MMRLRRRAKVAGALLAAWSLAACGGGGSLPSQPQLETITLSVMTTAGPVPLQVEVAHTPAQRRIGLMGRDTLADGTGMLFLYQAERPADTGFWMQNTLIPLDIAYLGEDGTIRAIRRMAPCLATTDCPTYRAGVPYSAALEVNQGWFADHGAAVGDRAVWEW